MKITKWWLLNPNRVPGQFNWCTSCLQSAPEDCDLPLSFRHNGASQRDLIAEASLRPMRGAKKARTDPLFWQKSSNMDIWKERGAKKKKGDDFIPASTHLTLALPNPTSICSPLNPRLGIFLRLAPCQRGPEKSSSITFNHLKTSRSSKTTPKQTNKKKKTKTQPSNNSFQRQSSQSGLTSGGTVLRGWPG